MIAFPDTSFLCAMYVRQENSQAAAAHFKAMPEALHVSGLLLYEFR
jgi:predicted nucleic acid-binding protein